MFSIKSDIANLKMRIVNATCRVDRLLEEQGVSVNEVNSVKKKETSSCHGEGSYLSSDTSDFPFYPPSIHRDKTGSQSLLFYSLNGKIMM